MPVNAAEAPSEYKEVVIMADGSCVFTVLWELCYVCIIRAPPEQPMPQGTSTTRDHTLAKLKYVFSPHPFSGGEKKKKKGIEWDES